jgi:hypothetical protein
MTTKRPTSTLGRSAVYRIHGCTGSQRFVPVEENLSFKEARRRATARNKQTADCLGLEFKEFCEKYDGHEGWFLSGPAPKIN